MPDLYSRRQFLGAAAGALGLGSVLAACASGEPSTAAACEGYDALSPEDLQQRASLQYVDQTPNAAQRCDTCRFYQAPASGSACGGCQLFAGPVVASGYCRSWVTAT